MNKDHLRPITDYPEPTNAKEVQSCLGLLSYFQSFLFDDDSRSAFQELKHRLVSAPVLAIYSPDRQTQLHCDASSKGYGSILLQKDETGRLHPIAYYSKATTLAKSNYNIYELETLAIINSLKHFRIYLEGQKFRIVTDCHSLAQTLQKTHLNHRITRWALQLQNYDYEVFHSPGTAMMHVDALSRSPLATTAANAKIL